MTTLILIYWHGKVLLVPLYLWSRYFATGGLPL